MSLWHEFATGIGLWAPQAVVYNLTGLAFRRLVLYVGVDQGKLGSGYTGPEPIKSNGVLGWYGVGTRISRCPGLAGRAAAGETPS